MAVVCGYIVPVIIGVFLCTISGALLLSSLFSYGSSSDSRSDLISAVILGVIGGVMLYYGFHHVPLDVSVIMY